MGETARLNGPLAGQFGLNDWLKQRNNAATPEEIGKAILPVQEMRDFQRRYVFSSGAQALVLGERIFELRFVVPECEWWTPLAMQYENADDVDHVVECSITVDEPSSDFRLVRTNVFREEKKLIFGALEDGSLGSASNINYQGPSPIVLEPGDEFVFGDLVNVNDVAGVTQKWTFVYELVPQPSTQRTAGVDGLVTVK